MSSFFRITSNIDTKVVGFVPQIYNGIISNVNDPNSLSNLDILDEASPETVIPKGILARRSKRTDLISASFLSLADGLLVSERLCNILFSRKVFAIQKLRTTIIDKNKKEFDYFLLRSFSPLLDAIDFKSSTFCYMDSFASQKTRAEHIESGEQLFKSFTANRSANMKNPSLQNEHLLIDSIKLLSNTPIDFFSIFPLVGNYKSYFVSNELRLEIEKSGCTGVTFLEI